MAEINTEMLAKTPPMGWNSWNTFMLDLDENTLKEVAIALKEQGFLEAGYNYFSLDDGWENPIRRVGHGIDYDEKKFPSGLKSFGDFLHGLGFKFGIYSCAGTLTCGGYPASYGYEMEDAQNFADWGVDLVKYDNCYVPADANSQFLYRRMGQALRETGRPILYSMCNWGFDESEKWVRSAGAHIYRIGTDSRDTWENVQISMDKIAQKDITAYSGVNCFADPDFLIAGMNGDGAVSHLGEEKGPDAGYNVYKVQFSLWCMICSPLIMSHDPRKTTDDTKKILLNKELIAVNQDIAGIPAFPCKIDKMIANDIKNTEIWAKPLHDGDVVLGMFNRRDYQRDVVAGFNSLGWTLTDTIEVYDLWEHKQVGTYRGNITVKIPARDCAVFRLHRVKQ